MSAPFTANRGKSVSREFAHVPSIDMPRSDLNRSHRRSMTGDAGYLNPIFLDEILPGDTINLTTTSFVRLATPIRPVMDNLYLETFFFFVPNRLVWTNWRYFMGEETNPGDPTVYTPPTITSPAGGYAFGSLQDHLGIPPGVAGIVHQAMPLRACNLIYNEWFRDQDLQNKLAFANGNGPDTPGSYQLFRRGKRHDYFTASRPFSQKGADVSFFPLGAAAPVVSEGTGIPLFKTTAGGFDLSTLGSPNTVLIAGAAAGNLEWDTPSLEADLTSASAATINQLRQSLALQTLYERDARGGTRYPELLRAHFGVISPDQRLQRPEYLGGSSNRITVHPVSATTGGGSGLPDVGELGAFITGGDTGRSFTQSFTEHGYVIGFAQVRADLTYQRGLERHWSRTAREEYYWPDFSMIGEQEVLSKEIYVDGTSNDDDVWGFQERYGEYRYKPSTITGKFRSEDPTSLDVWNLSQDFGATRPTLGSTFIQDTPPVDRIVQTPSEPELLMDFWFEMKHIRPMPVFGIPRLGARL